MTPGCKVCDDFEIAGGRPAPLFLRKDRAPAVPARPGAIRLNRVKNLFLEALVTVLNHRCEFRQRHQFIRFDQVLFFAGPGDTVAAVATRVRFFPDHPFADEICRCFSASAICRFEDNSVSQIQRYRVRFVAAAQGK